MKAYITVSGDTWDMISFKVYGKEQYAKELVEANPEHVYTVVFSAGVRLIVPEITPQVTTLLPPWKRGVVNVST